MIWMCGLCIHFHFLIFDIFGGLKTKCIKMPQPAAVATFQWGHFTICHPPPVLFYLSQPSEVIKCTQIICPYCCMLQKAPNHLQFWIQILMTLICGRHKNSMFSPATNQKAHGLFLKWQSKMSPKRQLIFCLSTLICPYFSASLLSNPVVSRMHRLLYLCFYFW